MRPQSACRGNEDWFGKVRIFRMTFQEVAKRSSKNQPVGTMETKPIASIIKEVTKDF
jgi:hypothetical protein